MESLLFGSLRIGFGLCHTGTPCLHGASLRSISFNAHESSCRYVLADIHPEAFRDVRARIPK